MKTVNKILSPAIRKLSSYSVKAITIALMVFSFGFVIPEQNQMPVQGASARDWNPQSFWYFPWGRSRVHRGLDIFAQQGTPVVAPTGGFILFAGKIQMGGNVVYMLGPKWRFHYFAHLEKTQTRRFGFVDAGQQIGTVGSTGNARGKAPHLHYSIRSLFPQFWKYKPKTIAAWDRMFFVNPDHFLRG